MKHRGFRGLSTRTQGEKKKVHTHRHGYLSVQGPRRIRGPKVVGQKVGRGSGGGCKR